MSSHEPPDEDKAGDSSVQAQPQEEPPPFEPDLDLITYLEKRVDTGDTKPGRVADR